MRRVAAAAAGLAMVGLAGCASTPQAGCLLADQSRQQRILLFFGLDRPHLGPEGTPQDTRVSEAQWRDFVDRVVTPRFPDGLTELDANGQWRDRVSNRIGREPSRILLLITPDAADLAARVEAIRTQYRAAFDQQSVGVESEAVCTGF